jgi:ABC-2 type transport system ATP-binding protein
MKWITSRKYVKKRSGCRENTYLRGAILGYDKQFLDEKYPEIIAFAELSEFQDFAFQQLSSGMKSRLAFSIACLIQPEIVILDEVLSVGDGAFRRKSEAKMLEVIESGATTIFVSHNTEQIKRLCNKVLWLERGCQIAFGDDVKRVCEEYDNKE